MKKMRSKRDLDSWAPRHNRQGFTPRELPLPFEPHLSQNNNREEELQEKTRGPVWGGRGMVPAHHLSNLHTAAASGPKPLEIPGKGT